ncbi:MAG: EF-P lysine aminoacylase GenX [Planctomycetaceae bacterium]|nr:EF-P lysine aminoacylase GenX [Planctomycetaceae bacterium]
MAAESRHDCRPADHRPTASFETLRSRAGLLRRVRAFFDARGFLEVETPCLSADVVVDRHLDPLEVTLPTDVRRPDVGRRLYLQTSPEFHMKRLLAAGAGAIYQIARVFRAGESGPRHNPEFTLVEWYRPGDSYAAGRALLSDLGEALFGLGPAEQLSYGAAFARYVGLDPHSASLAELNRAVAAAGGASLGFAADDRDGRLDYLLVTCVEPRLGVDVPTILYDYPASQAALAQVRPGPPAIAERFELYVRGIELANGYHELLDANELRQRNAANNRLRSVDGKPELPEESRLLAAMQAGLPESVGAALGFDRLVMLATGAETIDQVLAFPIDRA